MGNAKLRDKTENNAVGGKKLLSIIFEIPKENTIWADQTPSGKQESFRGH